MLRLAPLLLILLIALPAQAQDAITSPDEYPRLIGGVTSLVDEIRYPESAKAVGVEGTVFVKFVVDENGRVIEPEVLRSVDPALDAEALRVTQQARFTAGRHDGNPVKVRFSLPIRFLLADAASEPEQPDPNEVYVIVENPPELIGGLDDLQRRLQYPELARRAGIEGTVFVQFVVDEQGNATEPVCVRDPGGNTCAEALRAVRASTFKPGRQHGKPVKVRFSLPVKFEL